MPDADTIIKVRDLKKYFELKKGFLSFRKDMVYVKAVDGVNFDLRSGEILGLVGESGCGKTTVGRLLTRLEDPTDGFVFFLGRDIALIEGQDVKVFRRNIQMVFQDPYESLNPRTTVTQAIMEPLLNHNIGGSHEERIEMVVQALEDSGLAPAREYLNRFPHELSGGQRQRVSIARALVVKPRVIVADEPVSMLDVSIRAGVLNLMLDLRDKYGIPYLFITHDIAVARYISDRLAVMYLGRVVEMAETDKVIFESRHPYTQALLSAVPIPDPEAKHGRIKIRGEVPSAANIPLGCRFRPRCPKAFRDCGWEAMDFVEWLEDNGHLNEDATVGSLVSELHPEGWVLRLNLRDGVEPAVAAGAIRDLVTKGRSENPLLAAVESVDTLRVDRVIEIKSKSASMSSENLAGELLALLEATVSYKEPDHPMHGIIAGMRLDGDRLTLSVGGDSSGPKLVQAFMEDYVRHHRRKNRPEFRGARRITSNESDMTVTIACSDSKEPAAKTAEDIAEFIEKRIAEGDFGDLTESILPVETRRRKVNIRIAGPEENWPVLLDTLNKLLGEHEMEEGGASRKVSDISLKTLKDAHKSVVVVRFARAEEPPLFDVGNGHKVACYLFRGGSPQSPP